MSITSAYSQNITPFRGTYYVDPVVPEVTPTLSKSDRMQRDAARAHHKNAKRAFGSWDVGHDSKRSCGKRKPQEINASFRTRHGAVTLDVAVVGTESGSPFISKDEKIPTRVMASSREGRVNVNLFEIHPGRCVDLDVTTRHGAITVFLPATFNGPIAFRTRRGREGITFLPEMARRTSIVRASDSEVLVVLTKSDSEHEPASTSHVQFQRTAGDDCALIGTRHGKILVGISGVDRLDTTVAPPSLLQKLGGLIESKVNTFLQTHAKAIEAKMLGMQDRTSVSRAVARARMAIS
ncbi:hypothetical protein CERSUDRAFT_112989 [Gelatoporia subvermispora B]|uniref:DUF7330 domain-containing protein n=1 Tax=Ceriporiopsis subvermispora (strain B) TaxID=914234 RepID=M2PRV2_CERS8|nr:hypothetical protein CERSUDRAFT_112989 [Gelatoporia subvermispora B]